MGLLDIGTRLEDQNPTLYLGVGALSLAKAGVLGRIGRPAGRELRDAGLFIGAGLLLRTYQGRRKARTETAEEATSAAKAEGTESAENAEDVETEETDDSGDVREPTADEPVVVTGTGEDEETRVEHDRRRSPVAGAVATAVKRLSGT